VGGTSFSLLVGIGFLLLISASSYLRLFFVA
jgi:hypothetical protein